MKVYVVSRYCGDEGYETYAVFSDPEKAKAFLKEACPEEDGTLIYSEQEVDCRVGQVKKKSYVVYSGRSRSRDNLGEWSAPAIGDESYYVMKAPHDDEPEIYQVHNCIMVYSYRSLEEAIALCLERVAMAKEKGA